MEQPHLAIAAPSFCRDPDLCRLATTSLPGWQLTFCPEASELTGPALRRFLSPAQVAIIGKERVDADLLAALPGLRAIAKYGVGLDSIDLQACERAGVQLYHQAGVNAAAVAELSVGLMLALCRKICEGDRLLRAGEWRKNGGRQLTGSKVAIVGCGAVGSRLAYLLKAFGCQLYLCDIEPKIELAQAVTGRLCSLSAALAEADFISLHVPLTPLTHELINSETLAACRPGAFLINTSRGAVVAMPALKAALRRGQLGGAGLDVFPHEPFLDNDLLSLPQVVTTPHIAGNAKEAVLAMGKAAISGILEYSLLKN